MLQVKSWFINKNFTNSERVALSDANFYIEKETEKAYFLRAETDYGRIKFWCPKSCTYEYVEETEEEIEESMRLFEEKLEKGLAYNTKLKEACINAGIKGVTLKRRLSNAYLINKLQESGIEVPANA